MDMTDPAALKELFTPLGIEVPTVTADQMREVDRMAMEETGPNLFQMTENAGRNLAQLAIDLPPLNGSRSYVRVWPKGGPYATSSSHRRTDPRQAA